LTLANRAHRSTGWGPYFGSEGSVHMRNVEPLPLVTIRTKRQPWHRLVGNGALTGGEFTV
jgi:hypothetical protein